MRSRRPRRFSSLFENVDQIFKLARLGFRHLEVRVSKPFAFLNLAGAHARRDGAEVDTGGGRGTWDRDSETRFREYKEAPAQALAMPPVEAWDWDSDGDGCGSWAAEDKCW
jgi:hypothetical protein